MRGQAETAEKADGAPADLIASELGAASFFEAGQELALRQPVHLPGHAPFRFIARIEDNKAALLDNFLATTRAAREGALITPAAEWLLDNHRIVEENFRHLRRDLVPRYFRSLPRLSATGGAQLPAVLALAWNYVALTNSELSLATLTETCEGFQSGRILRIGEIWAIPAMLRFVLLENLRRISDRVARARRDRQTANLLADRLIREGGAAALLSGAARGRVSDTFAAQLLYRLRDGSGHADEGLEWLHSTLAAQGSDIARVLAQEHARQSSANVVAGNIVRSLKWIDDTNWTDWFETVSRVDAILRSGADFPLLDRPTRNTYRDTIERIARRSRLEETEVARRALDLAGGEATGHLLVGARQSELEAACGYRPRPAERLRAFWRRLGWFGVFGPAFCLTFLFALLAAAALPRELQGPFAAALFLLALPTASEAAMEFIRFLAARLLPQSQLPAFDYEKGIPEEARTLVVVPCLIPDFDTVDELAGTLELHYLANPDGAADFALLTDWPDAQAEETPRDREVLEHASAAIEALARKYAHVGRRFFLLHRRRLWNETDRIWMGWERKRGKLAELNMLLLNAGETTFLPADPPLPEGIRFVVTLDSDTRLPRGTVARLAGKMMHPVNRPVADPKTGVVTAGHAVMQPRVTPSLTTGAEASVFQHVFSAGRGLDPYVFTVSDLWQDLLDAGSFTGKGIYDVAAFHAATGGRFPENAVLSHDLIEGSLARAALVSDVQVIEDFPTRYDVDISRQHRWARGDWQLLPFLLDFRNGVDGLGRLKMADTLRRSLVPPSWVAASVLGWLVLPARAAWTWQLALLLTLFFVPLLDYLTGLVPQQKGVSRLRHVGRMAGELGGLMQEIGLRLAFMAHRGWVMLDAIGRTLWRLAVSRRHLLDWRTAREVQGDGAAGPGGWWRRMAVSPMLGAAALVATALVNPPALPLAVALALPWICAPAIAQAVSRSMETEDRLDIRPADAAELRRIARTTWRYFETFVTETTRHLPPDNFQETPEPRLAERTSPTNIGLYLLSVLTARDMGWIGIRQAVGRIERTLDTLERMERHRGHWFNWYDTRDLRVLEPRYVSAVDSGNLAGHLVTLASALRGWAANPAVYQYGNLDGIGDTLAVLSERLRNVPDDRRTLRPLRRRLEELIEGFGRSHDTYRAEPQLAPVRALNLIVIANDIRRLAADLDSEAGREETRELVWWADALHRNCEELIGDAGGGRTALADLGQRAGRLAELARRLAFEMDFSLLFDREKHLLSIGYRLAEEELDDSCYDLLASEARLASLFAIAKGDVPTEHWLRLGRPMTAIGLRGALLSWSGSMFEYLMPPLVMHERTGGILNASNALIVREQIRHGRRLGLPWGVSESAFNARDRDMNYQYHAFGVPALGLRRAVGEDRVIAPYATLLAAQILPREAVANLARLDRLGAFGRFGYCDAVDFTPARLPEGQPWAVVRNFMAHHHGMSIVAIGNAVLDGIHRDRFHSDEVVKAAELLLQEKAPREIVPVTQAAVSDRPADLVTTTDPALAFSDNPAEDRHLVALLSNGRLSTLLSPSGAGPVRWDGLAVTRWRPDPTLDDGGIHLFLRDLNSGRWWSATTTPRRLAGERAQAVFADHKAEFRKTAAGLESVMEVIVAPGTGSGAGPDAAAEGRRLTIRNTGSEARVIEVTSYGEIVLDRPEADLAHPAFSKMFVQTAIRDDGRTITALRKPRMPGERAVHLAHILAGAADRRSAEAETDRRAFLGRGNGLAQAAAFAPGARLRGGQGHTLDPIFSIRRRLTIPAGKSVALTFWTILAGTAEELDRAIAHFRQDSCFDHEERMAWTMSQVQLRHAGIALEEAVLFRSVAAAMIWPDPRLAIQDEAQRAGLGAQDTLWPLGISGDRPILLLRTDTEADLPILRKAVRMFQYFRLRGVAADLVILNERKSSYVHDLQAAIQSLCDMADRADNVDAAHRTVFAVRRDQMPDASFATLVGAARVVLHTRAGRISEQLLRLRPEPSRPVREPRRALPPPAPAREGKAPGFPAEELRFWNGLGGFSADGREYVVRLRAGERTPQPWINVIARPDFGFHVSAGGAAFTWSQNSRDYQITPWSNDPVTNRPGEALLIRNAATGQVVSPFAALSDDPMAIHEARHAPGRSTFRVWTDWIEAEAVMLLAEGVPARLTRLTLRNRSAAPLSVEAVAYAEPVLGNDRGRTAPMIRARHDRELDAVTARNPFATEVRGRVAAMAADRLLSAATASRRAFLGLNGSLVHPAALAGWPAAEIPGDPCLAAKVALSLPAEGSESVTFILADAPEAEIGTVLAQARAPDAVAAAQEAARREWDDFLGRVQVATPDPKLDLMVNCWLPCQALACRIRGRSAFYQASGAYGFRDQLQDTSALILHDPALARTQLLAAAGRQFEAGDVQHWWLPRSGAGVRTTISDDVVWLAHSAARYMAQSGDRSLLDEAVPFLTGPALEPGQHDAFFVPGTSDRTASFYEHCARGLDLAVKRTGADGLPLILGGDWNDGMNRVGEQGRGESVWLGWFLLATLDAFLPVAEARGDRKRAAAWKKHRARLLAALESRGWDGAWYRRGYYDDGTPLGSAESDECRIDSIAQSWASLSGAGDPDRARKALDAALERLVDLEGGLMRLFAPPFETTGHDPGYIKSYPPGVRENGGQYTHAAAWMVHALARAGRGTEAHELFDLINPISHALTREAAGHYRVEPYVVAADVYGAGDKTGRGGWTWYTGSAGWLYRAAVEGILGLRLEGGTRLRVAPALPEGWPGFSATVVLDGTAHRVEVRRAGGGVTATVDGRAAAEGLFDLAGPPQEKTG